MEFVSMKLYCHGIFCNKIFLYGILNPDTKIFVAMFFENNHELSVFASIHFLNFDVILNKNYA